MKKTSKTGLVRGLSVLIVLILALSLTLTLPTYWERVRPLSTESGMT